MAKRNIIAYFLSALLFVYFNNNLPFDLRPARGASHIFQLPGAPNLAKASLTYSHHTPKKEHVKVRYRGSECAFHVIPLRVAVTALHVAAPVLYIGYNDIVPLQEHCLFQLRGPPSLSC